MGILSWIVFGALAGWLASIIAGNNQRQGCLMNIVVGIVGAFLGGFLLNLITGAGFSFSMGFNLTSLIVAVVGAVLLLVITGAARRR